MACVALVPRTGPICPRSGAAAPHLQQTVRLARRVFLTSNTPVSPDSIPAAQPSPVSSETAPKAPSDSVHPTSAADNSVGQRGVPYVRATVSPDSIEATQPSPVSAASAPKAPSDSVQATLLDMPSEGSCPGSPPPSFHARAQQSFRLLSHATARTPARPGASIDIDRLSARIWQIQTLSSVPIPYPVARLAAMRNIDSFNNALQHALDLLAFPSPASQSSHWPSPLIAERPSNFSHAHHYALEG